MRRAAFGLLLLSFLLPGCSSEPAPASPTPVPQRKVATATAAQASSLASRPASMERTPVTYNPRGKRDPFISLLEPESHETGFDVGGFKLAGIVWQANQYFALLEAPDGVGHILKENDRLGPNAKVKSITKDTVLIEMTSRDFRGRGQARIIRLELVKEEGE